MGKTQAKRLRKNRKNPDIQSPGTPRSGGLFIKDSFAIRKKLEYNRYIIQKWNGML